MLKIEWDNFDFGNKFEFLKHLSTVGGVQTGITWHNLNLPYIMTEQFKLYNTRYKKLNQVLHWKVFPYTQRHALLVKVWNQK